MACQRITRVAFDLADEGVWESDVIACLRHEKVGGELVELEFVAGKSVRFIEDGPPPKAGDGIIGFLHSSGGGGKEAHGRSSGGTVKPTVPKLERLLLNRCLEEMGIPDGVLGSMYRWRRAHGHAGFVVEVVESDLGDSDEEISRALGFSQ